MIANKSFSELFTNYRSVALLNVRTLFLYNGLLQQTEAKSFAEEDGEFRVIDLKKTSQKQVFKKKEFSKTVLPPRHTRMPDDQDWSSVWPGPRSFHPATVPLPLHQGTDLKWRTPPGKYANAELMKIPNFLHLTPPAVKKHCSVLKQFCSPWPQGLETDEKCSRHFPLEVISTDYCHSSPIIRDPKARIVTIKFNLDALKLDAHAKDKFLRLVGDKYCPETNDVVIVADRCPVRKQNYEYALYLITACFHESWTYEDWEKDKTEADLEYYDWNLNKSKQNYLQLKSWPEKEPDETKVSFKTDESINYQNAVSDLFNKGENSESILKYKEAVKKIVGLA